MSGWPLPDLDHPLHATFWRAAAERRLVAQRCDECGYVRWPPAPVCPECLAAGGTWTDLSGRGTIWSIAVYEHAYLRSLAVEVPYTCALVELEEGPRMIVRLQPGRRAVEVGVAVHVTFAEPAPGFVVPMFAPVD